MTAIKKSRILDICGAVISFAAPASAAIVEFPYTVKKTVENSGRASFQDILHISSAAFAIIAIIAVLTAWRFFRNRLKMPKSGLALSAILWAICFGVEQFVHSLTVIMQWSTIGCAVAWVLYFIADQIRKKEGIDDGQ